LSKLKKNVGMTGFEPVTPRPPGLYATRLRYIPFIYFEIYVLFFNIMFCLLRIIF
jgi:hypothetical protein